MATDLTQQALEYHAQPRPGKIGTSVTKPAETARDLALAYSPGVAAPVRAIVDEPQAAYRYTLKGNLVAVISNGTAVLGLGDVGALASKPVMEGKALLFKRFAGLDAIDIEVSETAVERFVDTVSAIAGTFGGINLEDIRAPDCFAIEQMLKERCDIPVFHDDQHGTAIVIAAGLLNALAIQEKTLEQVKIVCLGAGAAAIAAMRLLHSMGAPKTSMFMLDRRGVLRSDRSEARSNLFKDEFVNDAGPRTLQEALAGADVLIGLSGANLVAPNDLLHMAARPIVFACSNPDPEVDPEQALAVRDDLILATGRSDYPNQVNNVLGFPFIFRGAMDVRASEINEAMKIAAVEAISQLARQPVPPEVLAASGVEALQFGRDYIIPKPMDARLLSEVSAAVARAAVDSGVARLPYPAWYPPVAAG